ncbi:MAG TPA: hypothetical protein VGI80_01740, partial [Pyrinomonadaceae bacterium]
QRLVHLVDPTNRSELMVIYLEGLPEGQTAASLNPGGRDAAKWPAVAAGLLTRAKANMKIRQ